MAGESISERESKRFQEGLNTKVKISSSFGKSIEFKKYLHGVADAGSRLLFKFRSGTHGLNEVIKNVSCMVMSVRVSVMCCGSVQDIVYSSRVDFLLKLQEKLDVLDSIGKSSFILGTKLWEEHFDSLLHLGGAEN